jgi:hypothetical protein
LSGTEYMLLTGRVNFGLIQLCLRMVPSYLRDNVCMRCDISPSSKANISTRDAPTFVDKYMHVMEAISAHFAALSTRILA